MMLDREFTRLPEPSNRDQEEFDQDRDGLDEPLLYNDIPDIDENEVDGADSQGHHATTWQYVETMQNQHGPPSTKGVRGFVSSPYVFFCATFSALGGLIFGIDQGIVSIILVMPQFLERFPEVSESATGSFYKGVLTAMIELGALIGALNQGWIADRYSRKHSIVLAVIVFVLGSTLQTAATNYTILAVARLVGGVGIGMLSMVIPLYISEISPPEMRGSLLVLEELSIVTGIILAFWGTYFTRYISSEWSWRLPFLLQMVPAIILGTGILFLPFSPRWLVGQGRDKEALKALSELRQCSDTDQRMLQEWFEIRAEAQSQREVQISRHPYAQESGILQAVKSEMVGFADCFRKGCWRRTQVGIGLMFFLQVSISHHRSSLHTKTHRSLWESMLCKSIVV